MQDRAETSPSAGSLRRLDPLAELMMLDTRAKFPMGFFIECGCEGELDREKLGAALHKVAYRHPNVMSHVVWKAGRPFWKLAAQPPELLWDPHSAGVDPWRPFDLSRDTGLRLVVLPSTRQSGSPAKWRIVLYGHHAVCDGLAVCELLGEIWTHYANRPLPSLACSEVPAAELSSASQPIISEIDKPIAERLTSVLAEALRFLFFFPAKLQRNSVATQRAAAEAKISANGILPYAESCVSPPYRILSFTEAQMASLRKAVGTRNVTLNTLMMAASMRVLAEWNREVNGSQRGIRITMPVSLRPDSRRQPAENRIGYAFLDRTFSDCLNEETLMQTLSEASAWIKKSGAARMFITAIGILTKIPGVLWLILRLPLCFSTAVVSNLGDARRCMRTELPDSDRGQIAGNTVITYVVGVPPVRPRTTASLGIVRYGNHLYVACLTDERTLGPAAAERLLARMYAECLHLASKS